MPARASAISNEQNLSSAGRIRLRRRGGAVPHARPQVEAGCVRLPAVCARLRSGAFRDRAASLRRAGGRLSRGAGAALRPQRNPAAVRERRLSAAAAQGDFLADRCPASPAHGICAVNNRLCQIAPIPDKGFSPTDRRRMTVTLPQSKLDALVTRLRTVEADLASGPDRDTYVKLSREFSELQPDRRDDQDLSRDRQRNRRSRRDARRPHDRPRDARARRKREARARAEARRRSRRRSASRSSPRTRWTSATSSWKSAPAPAATRPRCSPATCSACTSASPPSQRWKVEVVSASEGTAGGYKEIIAEIKGRGAFAKLKFESGVHRVQRVPDTEAGPHPHLGRDRRGAARGRGGRRHDQRRRPEDRHLARERRRRPARQQDRIRDPHHASADRHRGGDAGGPLAASQPRQGDGGAAHAALRRTSARSSIRRAPPSGAARSARATAPSASAPTIFRKAASPITASTSRSTSCRRSWKAKRSARSSTRWCTEHQAELLAAEDA